MSIVFDTAADLVLVTPGVKVPLQLVSVSGGVVVVGGPEDQAEASRGDLPPRVWSTI